MSIRLAASKPIPERCQPRAMARRMRRCCANDNGGGHGSDDLLRAALNHFALHGLAAGQTAMAEAVAAAAQGDDRGYVWWREICRLLDRRLADVLDLRDAASDYALGR